MLGLGAAARQPNAPAGGRGQMPSQGSDIFNRFAMSLYVYTFVKEPNIQKLFKFFKNLRSMTNYRAP